MTDINQLEPSIEILSQEYVLVQAFKKTVNYMRYHNWYADTLEMDWMAIDLPTFISELSQAIKNHRSWKNEPLRLVPAPRSTKGVFSWDPNAKSEQNLNGAPFRPLAKVSLKEQVLATAIMMCLADGVETHQGDPRTSCNTMEDRKKTISYGNRLFCRQDDNTGTLRHAWGSSQFYRAYFQDYQAFLNRTQRTAAGNQTENQEQMYIIVESDLSKFYDTVRPKLLFEKIKKLRLIEDRDFLGLCKKLFDWRWHADDSEEIRNYARKARCKGFSNGVALPQGLASAGFFANIVLVDFDDKLKESIATDITDGVQLIDVCRYVDDLRLVISANRHIGQSEEDVIKHWLQCLLQETASGLKISEDKTNFINIDASDHFVVPQSRHMNRIQKAISGGFDAQEGIEILDAIQGLIGAQKLFSKSVTDRAINHTWSFLPVTDAKDSTVERFAAGRFRKTYRSLRPLLADEEDVDSHFESPESYLPLCASGRHRSQRELDDEARAFSLGLIEKWTRDPSNVRLLRIALDLWPAENVLDRILALLKPFLSKREDKARHYVACYCLSEIFRAAATETGFVEHVESLPQGTDLTKYRERLKNEAIQLLKECGSSLPWYLEQQIFIFLIGHLNTVDFNQLTPLDKQYSENCNYYQLIDFCRNDGLHETDALPATIMTLLIHRSFLHLRDIYEAILSSRKADNTWFGHLAERDPELALNIIKNGNQHYVSLPAHCQRNLCVTADVDENSLLHICCSNNNDFNLHRFRDELGLLQFSSAFLQELKQKIEAGGISPYAMLHPADIIVQNGDTGLKISINATDCSSSALSLYSIPNWCAKEDAWRFQLGYLLRFALSTCRDFTTRQNYHNGNKSKTASYIPAKSHWHQRKYGMYNGQAAFESDWLPITDWLESFLYELLRWPGCSPATEFNFHQSLTTIESAIKTIEDRLQEMQPLGRYSGALMLRFRAPWPSEQKEQRPLRGCIVQTVIPESNDFKSDLHCNQIRKKHRNHLASALSAVKQMLMLRASHKNNGGGLDLLILPELAVHPNDIKTHLIPFARANRTIILAGITYDKIIIGKPAINSAIWIMPKWSAIHGLQIVTRRQGKNHLAPLESKLFGDKICSFSPAQWLVGYPWSPAKDDPPLWLTAAICYDATDMELVADLKGKSDVFIIPALNKDVTTYDNMAKYLHYGMFQLLIVANSGEFGGSNAYLPYKRDKEVGAERNCLFHLHGRPQATMAFWELQVDDIINHISRKENASGSYKPPPASNNM